MGYWVLVIGRYAMGRPLGLLDIGYWTLRYGTPVGLLGIGYWTLRYWTIP